MSTIEHIKVISFDGDMTLWDFNRVMRNSLSVALREIQRRVTNPASTDLTIDTMIEIRNSVAAELKGKITNLEEIRFHAFCRTLEQVGVNDNDLATELNTLSLKHRFEDVELYPDVIPCLETLRENYTIGLLSNGNSYPERCGLSGYFNFAIFSQDVGVDKPDARMFNEACKEAGCATSELMHVGDSQRNDVAGANGVGAVSVWLNRSGRRNGSGIEANFEIKSLIEIAKIVNIP